MLEVLHLMLVKDRLDKSKEIGEIKDRSDEYKEARNTKGYDLQI